MSKKKVSVIITTYNTNGKLKRAIDSIIYQTYENFELIVIDDNNENTTGRKKTELIMESYINNEKVIYIKHAKNKNGAYARNTGIKKSTGEYICFLDDDDFYLPNRIQKSVEYLENNKKFDGVFVDVGFLKKKKIFNIFDFNKCGNLQLDLLLNNNYMGTGSNIFIRKTCLDKLIGFDVNFLRFQDVEFMIRFFNYYKIGSINKVLVIKDSKDFSNVPNFEKMKQMVDLFLKKFDSVIKKYSDDIQKQIINNYLDVLFGCALNSKNKSIIKDYELKIKLNRKLTLKEKVKKNLYFINFSGKMIRFDKESKYTCYFYEDDLKYLHKEKLNN